MEQDAQSKRVAELFKDRLKAARKQAGLTQDELATKAGISVVTLSKLETGVNKPAFDILVALAHALEASPSFLLGWDPQADAKTDASRRALLLRLNVIVQKLSDEWIEQLIALAERAAPQPRR
ncbi:helix-turn-helix domain-containing protein [Kaistia nematophila]|nr:helix-turn-helix transcriptional regulator [Kaistia nematophila]